MTFFFLKIHHTFPVNFLKMFQIFKCFYTCNTSLKNFPNNFIKLLQKFPENYQYLLNLLKTNFTFFFKPSLLKHSVQEIATNNIFTDSSLSVLKDGCCPLTLWIMDQNGSELYLPGLESLMICFLNNL